MPRHHKVKNSLSPHETFRLPWRSTAEARRRAGGARRLRGGRAAAAPSPGGLRAPAGPRAPLDAHRGEQLGICAGKAGEVQRGAADVLCCSHRGGWIVLHFVLGQVGINCRETTTTFSLYRSAIMHEHVNAGKWFIYAIIYHRCRVFCLYMYLLLFPTPPDHVPTLGKISWKYSIATIVIVTLYHTLKRIHQTWRIFKIHYTSKELRGFWSHQQDSVANRIQWRPTK